MPEDEERADEEPGFTRTDGSGSVGGRARDGGAPGEERAAVGSPPSTGDRPAPGWQGRLARGGGRHTGPLVGPDEPHPPRMERAERGERALRRRGRVEVAEELWEEHGRRKGTAEGLAGDEPPVE